MRTFYPFPRPPPSDILYVVKRCTQCGVLNADHLDTCGSCGARGDSLVPIKEDGMASLAVGIEAPPKPEVEAAPAADVAPAIEAAPPRPSSRWLKWAAVVLALSAVGVLSAVAGLWNAAPDPTPDAPVDRDRLGFPRFKPDSPDGPTTTATGPGAVMWTATLRNQTHSMLAIDGG